MSEERDVEQWARAEADALSEQCTCAKTYATFEGPEADCPVHGAVAALHEVMAERDAANATLDYCTEWVSDLLDEYGLGRPDSLAAGLDQIGEAFRLASWLHEEAMWFARQEQLRREPPGEERSRSQSLPMRRSVSDRGELIDDTRPRCQQWVTPQHIGLCSLCDREFRPEFDKVCPDGRGGYECDKPDCGDDDG